MTTASTLPDDRTHSSRLGSDVEDQASAASRGPEGEEPGRPVGSRPELLGLDPLPPAEDCCQVCARRHEPGQPHDPQSLYWAAVRERRGLEPPRWEHALAHCSRRVRKAWVEALRERGIEIDTGRWAN